MRRITTSIPTKALIGCIAAATLALAACGGSDDSAPAQPAPTDAPSSDAGGSDDAGDADQAGDTGDTGSGSVGGGEIIDTLDDAIGGGLDEALDSLPAETLWGIVADQLGDDVDVEIEGADIRLTLNEGTADDSTMDCVVTSMFIEEGQVVTMVYPDGDVTCGE